MCGIVGAAARRDIVPSLLTGLRRLEYRGYDSAGVSVHNGGGMLDVRRCVGKIADLARKLDDEPISGRLGIGHTRWATHGAPDERNAHPHVSYDCVAVVHNGIIENHEELRTLLTAQGYPFASDTDTEVIAHLIHHHLMRTGDLLRAVRDASGQLSGAYAIAVMAALKPDLLVVARRDSPLAIGIGSGEQFVASDPVALLPVTQRFIFLEEGDVAELFYDNINIVDASGKRAVRETRRIESSRNPVDKGPYRHYMLKEIHEQSAALAETLQEHVAQDTLLTESLGFKAPNLIDRIKSVQIVACGTSHHAGEVGRYWLEAIAGTPCSVDLASEYRYRAPAVPPDCLFVAMSQSGETADTLAALRYAKNAGYLATLSVSNVAESSLVRESDMVLLTRAGPEMGVAATKTFTCQLLSMLMLAILLGQRQLSDPECQRAITRKLTRISEDTRAILNLSDEIETLAAGLAASDHALFLARGSLYPIAKEGALKLKEISYIHAEAYAAGELKHGPLALVSEHMPVVALAPSNICLGKIKANLREVQARNGRLIVFTDAGSHIEPEPGVEVVRMPMLEDLVSPIGYSVALQLLAYHTAAIRGTDIDQPRNLAKSVTVE